MSKFVAKENEKVDPISKLIESDIEKMVESIVVPVESVIKNTGKVIMMNFPYKKG